MHRTWIPDRTTRGSRRALSMIAIALSIAAAACATDIRSHVAPVELKSQLAAPARITIVESTSLVPVGSVEPTPIRAHSSWVCVGRIDRGDVYRPIDTVLQLKTGNAAEAYLVLNEARAVGFYVPHAHGFLALVEPTPIVFIEAKES